MGSRCERHALVARGHLHVSDPSNIPGRDRDRAERVYEPAADPAEGANRPLEPKSPDVELSSSDDPGGLGDPGGADHIMPEHAAGRA